MSKAAGIAKAKGRLYLGDMLRMLVNDGMLDKITSRKAI